ncbi:MAG: glycosyltransferase family 2 protein [Pseudomonadales bacterium]|nr:glycosyltransferase family 2 protein [Candidatus Woesebacteria bacterium]MCB9802163.1 glycosyltransferase family 2 protein [Pseudomonadales bacterium]
MKQPTLEIIIVTYNSQFWLEKTLSTLHTHYLTKTKNKVIVTVVDNNSSDDTKKMLERSFPWVTPLYLEKNYGFAYANNRALERSTTRYCMLLNSDIECTPESTIDTLIAYMDAHPQVGVITPKIVYSSGELDMACHRGEPTPWASLTYFMGASKLLPHSRLFAQYHQSYKNYHSIHAIDACSGAALLVRQSAIKKVGLLDEQFFMYAEDLDWCTRIREAGYEIVYNPEVVVVHHKYKSGIKSSSKKLATTTRKHFYHTMLQYYDKHYKDSYPSFIRTMIQYFVRSKEGI